MGRDGDALDHARGRDVTAKIAVVTGGSRGIGRASAVALAEAGWTVAIGYRSSEKDAKETVEALSATGTQGLAVALDVTDEASVHEAFRRVTDEVGNVTGLLNNAGMSRDGLLIKYPLDVYEQTMATNLRGSFLCSQAALRGMLREKWGRIVNMSSAVAIHGNAGQTVYAATKSGLVGLTKSLAREMASKGAMPDGKAGSELSERFEALLEQHFAEHWTVAHYADALSVTPTHLSRVTRSATGHAASHLIVERIVRGQRTRGLGDQVLVRPIGSSPVRPP